MGKFSQFSMDNSQTQFMEGRVKGDIDQLAVLEEFNLDDFGIINTEYGESAVFTVQGIDGLFFFNSTAVLDAVQYAIDNRCEEDLRNAKVSVESRRNKRNTQSYWAWKFVD